MPKNSSKPKSEYAIQTVTNALRMLEVFHTRSEMGVSDLARQLGLHKNNAFRLLATLELAGYIQQTPETELYHLGPRCLELGHAFARSHTLMAQARPILEELTQSCGETAHLGVLSGHEVAHLDGVLPDQRVLTGSRVGERLPAHCTALGKALLAGEFANGSVPPFSGVSSHVQDGIEASRFERAADGGAVAGLGAGSADERARTAAGAGSAPVASAVGIAAEIAGWTLSAYTPATITDPTKLVEELRTIQLRGYATDCEEFEPGLCCVAAPVRDARARVIGALSLSGPSMRLTQESLHGEAASAISTAAGELSKLLGSPI